MLIDIPDEFHSFDSREPFKHCIECEKYLLAPDVDYFIEKAVKKYIGFSAHDVVFEYAICLPCAERMKEAMSKASLQALEQYFMKNINVSERLQLISTDLDYRKWVEECIVTGKKREGMTEYQLFAQCLGERMVLGQMPYVVSGETLEQLASLLSKSTLDEFDDFSRRHFGPPPALEEDMPYKRVLLV